MVVSMKLTVTTSFHPFRVWVMVEVETKNEEKTIRSCRSHAVRN